MNYEQEARDFISSLERKSRRDSLESFYRGLSVVASEIKDRLNAAHDELDEDTANEVTQI